MVFIMLYESLYRYDFQEESEHISNVRAMVTQSFTSFPVIAYLVDNQLKITNSELGRLGLSSALVADVLENFCTILLSLVKSPNLYSSIENTVPLLYLLVLVFILRPAMFWVIIRTSERKPINTSFINTIVALAFTSEVYF